VEVVKAITVPVCDVPGAKVTSTPVRVRLYDVRRDAHSVLGITGTQPVFSHANTVGNMTWALKERVLGSMIDGEWTPTIRPERFATAEMLRWRGAIERKLGTTWVPDSRDDFITHATSGKRKVIYQAAAVDLSLKPLEARDAEITAFLKAEKWRELKAPRVISPRCPRYLLETGRYLHPIEKHVYRAIEEAAGYPVVMKGYTQERRAEVLSQHGNAFQDPVYVGLDASKFDQHVSVDALKFEHHVYNFAYNQDPELRKMLRWQLKNKCYFNGVDGRVRWTTLGGRMSGDMNTALGNCILSAIMLLAYSEAAGVRMRCVVDGDDCVAVMERRDVEAFISGLKDWYLRRGFRMKVERPCSFKRVEFCQCTPVLVSGVLTMVRNPRKALAQDMAWIQKGGVRHQDVVAATGVGGVAAFSGVPVLEELYRFMARHGSSTEAARGRVHLDGWAARTHSERQGLKVDDAARVSFWEAFGIDPGVQMAIEEELRSLKPLNLSNIHNIHETSHDLIQQLTLLDTDSHGEI
jgi:hypothetical protein